MSLSDPPSSTKTFYSLKIFLTQRGIPVLCSLSGPLNLWSVTWLSDWVSDWVTNCRKSLSCYSQLKIYEVTMRPRLLSWTQGGICRSPCRTVTRWLCRVPPRRNCTNSSVSLGKERPTNRRGSTKYQSSDLTKMEILTGFLQKLVMQNKDKILVCNENI